MAAFAWRVTAASDVTLVTNIADETLAALNTLIVAQSASGSAKWEVVSYVSASPKSLLLRRKNGAAGRIVIFGQAGSTANAAAITGSAVASMLYIGYSPTSTSNTVDGSWLSGAPLSASDYMPGSRLSLLGAGAWRFSYAEFSGGIYLIFTSSGVNGHGYFAAGEIVNDFDGNAVSAVLSTGSGNNAAWVSQITTNSVSLIPMVVSTSYSTNTDPLLLVRYDGANRVAFRATALAATTMQKLQDTANARMHFLPIALVFNSSDVTYTLLGQLKQVGFGPNCLRETVRNFDGVYAYGQCQDISLSNGSNALWFVDAEI